MKRNPVSTLSIIAAIISYSGGFILMAIDYFNQLLSNRYLSVGNTLKYLFYGFLLGTLFVVFSEVIELLYTIKNNIEKKNLD